MATYKTKRGTTSLLIDLWIGDSTSTTGGGKTGLVYNSAGLVCKVQESDTASATTVTLASATEGSFTSGGFVESALGNGWYQLGIPNANIDSGTKTKGIIYGAADMVPTPFVIELDAIDYQDSVRAGLTALPNAAADAAGGLPISDAGGLDLDNRMPTAAAITNLNTVFNTDFANNYNTTADKWKVDVTHAGGTAVTATGGRLEVDTTHWGGVVVGSAVIQVDLDTIKGQSLTCAAPVTIGAYVGGTGAAALEATAQDIKTVTDQFVFTVANQVDANALSGGGGLTEATLTKYIALLARSDSAIATDLATELANINQDFGTGTGSYGNTGSSLMEIAVDVVAIDTLLNDGSYGNAAIATLVNNANTTLGTPVTSIAADIAAIDTLIQDVPTVSEFEARTLPSADYFDPAADTVANVTTVATLTGHTPQTADVGKLFVRSNTAQSGSTSNTIKLDASASATNNLYRGLVVLLTGGTGAGQARTITGYNGTTKIANVDRAWITTPDNTSTFALIGLNNPSLNTNLQVSASTAQAVIRSGTAQSGSTSNTIKLDASASATNSIYVGNIVTITGGTGLGQSRSITAYVGATKVATVDRNWITTPDNTSTFAIYANTTPTTFSDQGVAQAAASGSITLAATASATNDIYVGSLVTILSGTAAGETSEITAYNGTTKVATVSPSWGVTPDTTSAYAVIPTRGADAPPSIPTAAEIRAEIDSNSTQLAAILDDTGTSGVVVAAASKSGYALSATGLDAITAGGVTLTVAAFRSAAVLTGTVTGAGTGTEVFTGYGMTVTVSATAAGNRTSVVYA